MKINLSVLITMLVILLMAIQGRVIYAFITDQNQLLLEQDVEYAAKNELSRLQSTLNYLLRVDDFRQIQEEITALGGSPNVLNALVINGKNQVLVSAKMDQVGKTLSSQFENKDIDLHILSELKKNMEISYYIENHSRQLIGIAPLNMNAQPGSIKQSGSGFVLLQYDLGWIESRAHQYLVDVAFPIAGVSAVLAMLLGLSLCFLLTRRINYFNKIARKVLQGDYSVRINSKGIDELGFFACTFDQTVENIQSKTEQLIKQHKKASLRERNLTVTLDSIGDAVITTDAEGKIIRMNPVAEELTGWSEANALHLPLSDVFDIFNSKTREKVLNPVEKVIKTRKIVGLGNHTSLKSKNNKEYQIADSAAPIINEGNEIIGVILVFHDISVQYKQQEEIRKSRQFLQSIIDNSPSLISVRDLHGNFLLSNKAHAGFLDYTPEEVTSSSIQQLFGKQIADHYIASDQAAIAEDELPEYEEIHLRDGKAHTFLVSKFKLHRNDEVYAVGTIATDVTIQKEQAEQLRRSQKMDALGKLTGGVAHDYNNMLGIILGYAELLSVHVKQDEQLKNYVEKIIHATERGADLTRRLLSFAGSQPGDFEKVKINSLVLNSVDMLKKTLTAKIAIDVDLQSDLWEVFVNKGELEDCLVNLSINALHAMPDGGSLKISTHNYTALVEDHNTPNLAAGDYVVLEVADTGAGISKENQTKVFDPFFTTKGEQGNGLGLSQVYGFIKRAEGIITLESEPNEGTTFFLYIPRYTGSIVGGDRLNDLKVSEATSNNNDKLILVVDDEPALMALAEELLLADGYQVMTAENGQDALNIISDNKIDLLITDVIMPEMGGYELTKRAVEIAPHINVLFVSGYSESVTPESGALEAPRLQKPYNRNVLLNKVSEILFDR
ncbi:MAG: PAS domain S-box protein [Pseudomonadales bacterium]|nr:PAS domain S-box protein [Pseudomonadales bacterium]